jgi:hypothetical protein
VKVTADLLQWANSVATAYPTPLAPPAIIIIVCTLTLILSMFSMKLNFDLAAAANNGEQDTELRSMEEGRIAEIEGE